MKITVQHALTIGGLRRCKLVAGEQGLNREIGCVDSMEIPDITPWLKEKELLVTTGYSIHTDTKKLTMLIKDLYKANAAGIAIKTRFLGNLPQEALEAADQYGIPIIIIPDDMSAVELTMPLMRAILDLQNEKLRFSSHIHNKFTELELSGGGLGEIAAMLHRLLDMPVAIADQNINLLSAAPDGADIRETFQFLQKDIQKAVANSSIERDTLAVDIGDQHVKIRKARFKEQVCCYILIFSPETGLDDLHMIALDHAATTAALEFSKLDALNQRLRLMDNNCFVDIILQNIKSEEEAKYRTQYLSWQNPPFLLVVYDILNFKKQTKIRGEMELLSLKQRVAEKIRQTMEANRLPSTIISQSDSFSCLCAVTDISKAVLVAHAVVNAVQKEEQIRLTAGISEQANTYIEICRAYGEATDALSIARKKGQDVIYIGSVGFERAVFRSEDKSYFQQFVENTVGKLAVYDEKNQTEFLYTLQMLVDNMGIRSQTAQAMFLHRNTLLARIRRIEEIIGCDLSRSDRLLELGIALKLRPFL